MANDKLIKILKKGSKVWNNYRKELADLNNGGYDSDYPFEDSSQINKNFKYLDLSGINLAGVDLFEADLSNVNLNNSTLIESNLSRVNFKNANLISANLSGSILIESEIHGATLINSILDDVNLSYSSIKNTEFYQTSLINSDFRNSKFENVNFSLSNLNGANLSGLILSSVVFFRANLENAIITNAEVISGDFRESHLILADLSESILNLADFSLANLSGINLKGSNLRNTIFMQSNLQGANLSYAILYETNFERANLNQVDFRFARFNNANLTGTYTGNSSFGNNYFINTDFSKTTKLENCKFYGPCILDIHTLKKSTNLPLNFLIGCGLPNYIISNVSNLFKNSIKNQSYFISCSSEDEIFAKKLYTDLQKNGIRCWFLPDQYYINHDRTSDVNALIYNAINLDVKIILVISKNLSNKIWINAEIQQLIHHDTETKILIPIIIDKEFFIDQNEWYSSLKSKWNILDFIFWRNEIKYQKSISQLIRKIENYNI
jgi:uncharacterized protein YjbI with pentapeptide repeats